MQELDSWGFEGQHSSPRVSYAKVQILALLIEYRVSRVKHVRIHIKRLKVYVIISIEVCFDTMLIFDLKNNNEIANRNIIDLLKMLIMWVTFLLQ